MYSYAKLSSAIAVLSIIASVNAQYDSVYARAADQSSDGLINGYEARSLALRDLEELYARDPSFKSFFKKIGHGLKSIVGLRRRDAEAEDYDYLDVYARDADAEAEDYDYLDLYARDADADADPKAFADPEIFEYED